MKFLTLIAVGAAFALNSFAFGQDGAQARTLKARLLLFQADANVPNLFLHQTAAPKETPGVAVKIQTFLNHEAESLNLAGDELVFTSGPERASINNPEKQIAKVKVPAGLHSAIFMFLPGGGDAEHPKFKVLAIDDSIRSFPRGSLKIVNLSHFPLRIELEKKPFDFRSGEIRSIENPPVGEANASAMKAFTFQNEQWQRIGAGSWPHPGEKRVLQVAFDNPVSQQVEMSGIRDIAVRDN